MPGGEAEARKYERLEEYERLEAGRRSRDAASIEESMQAM
jgi:hypothetical protein